MPPSEMTGTLARAGRVGLRDRGDLRHTGAGHNASGADRSGPMPTFTASAPHFTSAQAPSKVPTLPADQINLGELRFHQRDCVEHAALCPWALSMTSTSTLNFDQFLRALEEVAGGSDRGANARRPWSSLAALGYFSFF